MAANTKPNSRPGYYLSVYMPITMRNALRKLSFRTGVPQQRYLREGISHVLKKHGKKGGSK